MPATPIPLPVTVALAAPAADLPTGSTWAYEVKMDGHRTVLAVDEQARVTLQAGRSHRNVTRAFPDLAEAAAALPSGTVLDGEAVVLHEGVVSFEAVQQRALSGPTRAARLAAKLPATLVAFDALAVAGTDLRARPYSTRRQALLDVLAPLGPPLEPVLATRDRGEALLWMDALRPQGIEGIVAKRVTERYPAGRRSWVKVRHAALGDGAAVGYTGRPQRPDRLIVKVEGRWLLSTPLDLPTARVLAQALETAGAADVAAAGPVRVLRDGTRYRPLGVDVPVEVEVGTTRHRHVTVRRLRPDLM
ncbi:ATP-dependent DNA ligase [Streptomyces sp. NPDC059740]|uniref:ATP-dependent DNA ligase n=1 Tax=Streptomyces sp. NPDC059740 TaxID=3346926 RepID=UPI0036465D1C